MPIFFLEREYYRETKINKNRISTETQPKKKKSKFTNLFQLMEYFMSCFLFTFCSRRVNWHEVCAGDTPNTNTLHQLP